MDPLVCKRLMGRRSPSSQGQELLALELGYRESTESWAAVVRRLRERGQLPLGPSVQDDGRLGAFDIDRHRPLRSAAKARLRLARASARSRTSAK